MKVKKYTLFIQNYVQYCTYLQLYLWFAGLCTCTQQDKHACGTPHPTTGLSTIVNWLQEIVGKMISPKS